MRACPATSGRNHLGDSSVCPHFSGAPIPSCIAKTPEAGKSWKSVKAHDSRAVLNFKKAYKDIYAQTDKKTCPTQLVHMRHV